MASLRAAGVRRLNSLIQHSREPVFLLDSQGRFTFVNRAWEALTGYDAETILGRASAGGPRIDDGPETGFLPPDEAFAGRPSGARSLIVTAGGDRIWRRIEFWPYHDPEGHLLGLFGLVRDDDEPHHAADGDSLRVRSEWIEAREALRVRYGEDAPMGRGPRHERILDQIATASSMDRPVLIAGEPGTGRRHVARTIHRRGPRAGSALIPVDVAAFPPEALERDLFGVDPPGTTRLALPEGATLLLLDVIALPRDLQARLAVALHESSVRVLATGGPDPEEAVRDDRLRADLYYSLTVMVLRLAPLRERIDEIPLLAQHFLEEVNRRGARRRSGFSDEAIEALSAYDWPGNLRELARVVEASHGRGEADRIAPADLPASIRGEFASAHVPPPLPLNTTPLDPWLTQIERRLIEQALKRARQNKSRAAELLDISRPRLYRRIKELNIPDEGGSAEEGE